MDADRERLAHTIDHDDILSSLAHEIDKHNAQRTCDEEQGVHPLSRKRQRHGKHDSSAASMRLRFKADARKHGSSSHGKRHSEHRTSKRRQRHTEPSPTDEPAAAHPFPREPVQPDTSGHDNAHAAFRDSLFDALADDEGATYWESVYNEPIHIYARPAVQTPQGELERMNDDEYAEYVRMRMWEKKNPHIVLEREREERQKREAAEARLREREAYVRRRQRAAWERAEKAGARRFAGVDSEGEDEQRAREGAHQSRSRHSGHPTHSSSIGRDERKAWDDYVRCWNRLSEELSAARDKHTDASGAALAAAVAKIRWPVMPAQPITRSSVEAFLDRIPVDPATGKDRLQLLKAERVRWHPDKMQQRFGGVLDGPLVQKVTAVFQIIDAVVTVEREG